ncbi:MAG: Cys-tRNA(Pro) deacylase [Acidimicrobiales bacterium]
MTPAVDALGDAGVTFELLTYDTDGSEAYGAEAAAALGLDPHQVFKTLIAEGASGLVVAIVPVSGRLDLKALARTLGTKRLALADVTRAERSTGYVLGGISPFGQRRPLPTVLDESALGFGRIHVSGGRRGLEISLDPRDLVALLDAETAPITSG